MYSQANKRRDRVLILLHARSTGYYLYKVNEWSYVLKKETEEYGVITLNVYWNSRNGLFTFMSALTHPTQGKKQLTRKRLSVQSVKNLITNPRRHTGRGYYKK